MRVIQKTREVANLARNMTCFNVLKVLIKRDIYFFRNKNN
jgi:hypothetical protein